jgi:hypothetical protein
MKQKTTIYIALAAGVAIAGFAAYLLYTPSGKKILARVRSEGALLKKDLDETVSKVKVKLAECEEKINREPVVNDKEYA